MLCENVPAQEYLDEECNLAPESEDQVIMQKIQAWSLDVAELDLMHMIRGIYLNNVADDASDLVYDASDAATNPEPNFLTKSAVIEGAKVMGCKRANLEAMMVHEDVMISLEKRDLITTQEIDCEDGSCVQRHFFNNKEIFVVEDDLLTVNGDGTGGYITILFQPGAFAYGAGSMGDRALGVDDTDQCADGGMGSVQYIPRDKYAIHPVGWDNLYDPAANGDRTNMGPLDAANPANWCRVHDVRNVGMAFIVHTEAA